MRLAGLGLIAAVLAGCGSTTSSGLDDAVDATRADTSRMELVTRGEAEGEARGYVFEASGVVDYEQDRMAMTASESIPFFGKDAGVEEFRVLGRVGYLGWRIDDKTYWTKQDPIIESGDPLELLAPGPGSPTKPTDVLLRVLGASEENEMLGKENIRGEETTHYRARVDLEKLMKQLPAEERPEERAGIWMYDTPVPVDLWIDSESRLRRISATRSTGTDGSEWTMTLDLFDYGVAVDVEPPPSDQLISQERLEEMAGPPMVAASGEGEEVAP